MSFELGIIIEMTVGVLLASALTWLVRRAIPRGVRRVDNYALSIEEHDGFQFVQLKIQTDDGRFSAFELEPPVGHCLSDELLRTSARALADAHAPLAH